MNANNAASTASREILRVEGIWKRFGGTQVLRGLSLELKEKEILGVIGPSGGGKTTLLKCLDLLEPIDDGFIAYHGQHNFVVTANGITAGHSEADPGGTPLSEHAVSIVRQEIGFVFQGFNLWEERSVLENLTLAPTVVLGIRREAAESKACELCSQFGLADKVYKKAWQLSGGERQRVAIIRALMMKPRIMLLDEVTSALDPVLTVEVMQVIRKLREQGLTMIIVTHHIEFASTLCDRIMFLSRGQAVQTDTPENLRACPKSQDVKNFLEILRAAR